MSVVDRGWQRMLEDYRGWQSCIKNTPESRVGTFGGALRVLLFNKVIDSVLCLFYFQDDNRFCWQLYV